MKFLYADGLDFVDPAYDFLEDRSAPGRRPYWDDEYPHQYLSQAPYDGVLVSRGIVGDHKLSGRYTTSQAMRFRRDGARAFLRLDTPELEDQLIYGDCGAFSYSDYDKPPYTPTEILEFYEDGGFSHGCSVDHIIFEFERDMKGMECFADREKASRVKERFDITLENAEAFYKECSNLSYPFTPLGVVQGWSPGSMAEAARRLVAMGYDYLAIGGMVPLNGLSVHMALKAIRELMPDYVRLHLLGFGKIDEISEFLDYGIESIDTTSPMVRAFKDSRSSFFMPDAGNRLRYYSSIRIPNSHDHKNSKTLVMKGHFTNEFLLRQEKDTLAAVRALDQGQSSVENTLDILMEYTVSTMISPKTGNPPSEKVLARIKEDYCTMLTDRPWQDCPCDVCQQVGVEVAIFRASNRNKRRGIHNLWVFNEKLKSITGKGDSNGRQIGVRRHPGAAE
jgi:hypothetical protein